MRSVPRGRPASVSMRPRYAERDPSLRRRMRAVIDSEIQFH
jgi:hypothetical protein